MILLAPGSAPAMTAKVFALTLPPKAIFEPGNVTISYTPIEGGPIEEFTTGLHTATVLYWLAADGPTRARSYTWTFYVV